MNLVKRIGYAGLILLILLNVLGYYGVFVGLEYHNDRAMLKILDAGAYDGRNEITLKVPLSIPYLPDAEDFERVDGRFEHEGQVYRKVKHRYSQDTLYTVCVKDQRGTQLQHALTTYVKTFSDKPADSMPGAKISFSLIKEYFHHATPLGHYTAGWHYGLPAMRAGATFIASFLSFIIHPPE